MFRVLFVLASLYGHPAMVFNSEAECKKAMDSAGDKCVKVNHPYTLWAWDGGHWYPSTPALTLANCIDERDHFHLRGQAMWEQAQIKTGSSTYHSAYLPGRQLTGAHQYRLYLLRGNPSVCGRNDGAWTFPT